MFDKRGCMNSESQLIYFTCAQYPKSYDDNCTVNVRVNKMASNFTKVTTGQRTERGVYALYLDMRAAWPKV